MVEEFEKRLLEIKEDYEKRINDLQYEINYYFGGLSKFKLNDIVYITKNKSLLKVEGFYYDLKNQILYCDCLEIIKENDHNLPQKYLIDEKFLNKYEEEKE